MRLLIATPLYPPELGGPATYTQILERRLPEAGMAVSVVKFSDTKRYPKLIRHIVFMLRIAKEAKHADAILALDPVSTGLPAAIAAKIAKKPFLLKVVGDYAWEQGAQRFGVSQTLDEFVATEQTNPMVRTLQCIESWVAQQATQVLVPSEYLKRIVSAWGIAPECITVVYNAVAHEEPGAVPNTIENALRPRIVSMGRLVPWKGIQGLIDAFALVRERFSDAALIIVGEGPERARLEAYAASKTEGVMFMGALAHNSALAVITDADVFVLNTSYEGLSHALIETMAAGTPIITTPVGGNTELIVDGEEGLLVPYDDSVAIAQGIERIVNDPAFAEQLSVRAKTRAARFTEDAMIEGTVSYLTRNV